MPRNYKIPNPLKAMDATWKAAQGPTKTTPNPSMNRYSGPPIQLAGTKPRKLRKKKSNIPEGKI